MHSAPLDDNPWHSPAQQGRAHGLEQYRLAALKGRTLETLEVLTCALEHWWEALAQSLEVALRVPLVCLSGKSCSQQRDQANSKYVYTKQSLSSGAEAWEAGAKV